jgi:hypothetical protein
MGQDVFYFVFVVSIDHVGRWSGEGWSMGIGFSKGGKKRCVEDRVNLPKWGKLETI